ncbi:MAG: acetyl-CoA carboxylase carboxyl transferase subunit alpha/beta, partial [Candidatus Neomarinimicrobiota bacterium]
MDEHFTYRFERDGRLTADPASYHNLTEYEKYKLSFHPERPKYLDFLPLFQDVSPCLESDEFGSWLIQTHRARFSVGEENVPVMLIGQQTGPTSRYSDLLRAMADPAVMRRWGHGMPTPASYRRAADAVRLAS